MQCIWWVNAVYMMSECSVYDEWMSVYDEWLSVYGEWMQWVLGVCKDMNDDCAWRMLGECRCERLQIKKYIYCFVALSMQIIMCDDIQYL